MTIHLDRLPGTFAVARLAPDAGWPHWATWSRDFVSVSCTRAETSVVCAAECVPHDVRAERPFAAFVVRGPLPFTAVGILAALTAPLASAAIPVLAISTFDTDVLLVREGSRPDAIRVWREAGVAVSEG